jgi:hypothetical protein
MIAWSYRQTRFSADMIAEELNDWPSTVGLKTQESQYLLGKMDGD